MFIIICFQLVWNVVQTVFYFSVAFIKIKNGMQIIFSFSLSRSVSLLYLHFFFFWRHFNCFSQNCPYFNDRFDSMFNVIFYKNGRFIWNFHFLGKLIRFQCVKAEIEKEKKSYRTITILNFQHELNRIYVYQAYDQSKSNRNGYQFIWEFIIMTFLLSK